MEGISLDPRMLYDAVKNPTIPITPSNSSDFKSILKSKQKGLEEACYQMEALFVGMMLKEMRKNIPKNEFMHGGFAEEIFQEMVDSEYAINIARSKQFGFAKIIYEQYSKYL